MNAILIVLALLPAAVVASAHPELDDQIAAVTRRLEHSPGDCPSYLRRGELHRIHQEWDEALADFDRAAQCDRHLTVVDLLRGRTLFEAGRLDAAKASLDRFVATEPNAADGLVARARVLVAQGETTRAVEDYDRAVAVAASLEPDICLERAGIVAVTDPAAAVAGLEAAIKQLGPLVTLLLPALELELKLGRFDAALGQVDALAAQSPRKETWLARRGEILERAGREAEARAAYLEALRALESLPAARRDTPAMTALEGKLRVALRGREMTDAKP